jgi:hypothetical protein
MPKKTKFAIMAILLIAVIGLLCIFVKSRGKNDWLCIPGERVGPITSKTSEKQLIELFGEENVRREQIVVGEGVGYETATFVFKDSKDEIVVRWLDDQPFEKPESISIYKEGTQWRTPEGITIGTSLSELNEMNGKEFSITHLGWEFGGYVGSLNNGAFSRHKERGIAIRLAEQEDVDLPMEFYRDYFSSYEILSYVDMAVDLIRINFL